MCQRHSYYEFFAGGGMVHAGLGENWNCLIANDFDQRKAVCYEKNWGGERLRISDIAALQTSDLPSHADLAWASFPCQDLSLAGLGAGLQGARSGTFWTYWRLMESLNAEGRVPRIIALENVVGALSSHEGMDFAAIGNALVNAGYRFGAVVIDASLFLPQSRPRLFLIAVQSHIPIPPILESGGPENYWHPASLQNACKKLSTKAQQNWIWWQLPMPLSSQPSLSSLIDEQPSGVQWHSPLETEKLLGMMNSRNAAKVEAVKLTRRKTVGTIYKRTRTDGANGTKVQRAEVRFDDIAGCLRTPAGGSSRQLIIVVEGEQIRTRLLSPREAARLMGLPDSYWLPDNYTDAYHLAGDGVAVPVVRFLAENILEPLLKDFRQVKLAA